MPTYKIDPLHSIVEFAVKHMKVSTVKGRFLGLDGTIYVDEGAPASSWVDVKIEAASVDTGVKERDDHLRSPDFLNARLYPQIRFRSTRVERVGADDARWKVYGVLTMRGTSRTVALDALLEGRMVGVDFQERIGFSAETQVNRRDYGINWNGWMGQFLVDDQIRVFINIEAARPGVGLAPAPAWPPGDGRPPV
jgi:polyisoprenoid-binding protein YceI